MNPMTTARGVLAFGLTACCALGTTVPASRQQAPSPPRAAVRIERTELHGVSSVDPYRARFLIDGGYTSARQLAGEGTSAGGITIGGAITQQPALFAAALVKVGIVDALRFETTALGPQNAREFGSTAVPEEVKPLYDMSPYYHVVDGAHYPAVLLTAAVHDARVPVWEPAKMAARLQAATASDKPILLRIESGAGHGYGLGTTNSQLNEELADCYAFLFWQLAADAVRPHATATPTCR